MRFDLRYIFDMPQNTNIWYLLLAVIIVLATELFL